MHSASWLINLFASEHAEIMFRRSSCGPPRAFVHGSWTVNPPKHSCSIPSSLGSQYGYSRSCAACGARRTASLALIRLDFAASTVRLRRCHSTAFGVLRRRGERFTASLPESRCASPRESTVHTTCCSSHPQGRPRRAPLDGLASSRIAPRGGRAARLG